MHFAVRVGPDMNLAASFVASCVSGLSDEVRLSMCPGSRAGEVPMSSKVSLRSESLRKVSRLTGLAAYSEAVSRTRGVSLHHDSLRGFVNGVEQVAKERSPFKFCHNVKNCASVFSSHRRTGTGYHVACDLNLSKTKTR